MQPCPRCRRVVYVKQVIKQGQQTYALYDEDGKLHKFTCPHIYERDDAMDKIRQRHGM